MVLGIDSLDFGSELLTIRIPTVKTYEKYNLISQATINSSNTNTNYEWNNFQKT
jgi:Tfp pilus assembly major pilin PilA